MPTLKITLLLFLGFLIPATGRAETSLNQAIACFDTMLTEAKAGASFSAMVEDYVSYTAIAAQAVQVQKGLVWADMDSEQREPYIAAIKAYFNKEASKVSKGIGARDYVAIETVELRPRQHKKVSGNYQLAGVYKTVSDVKENFALQIGIYKGRCYIYDARWRDAWLSRYVPLP